MSEEKPPDAGLDESALDVAGLDDAALDDVTPDDAALDDAALDDAALDDIVRRFRRRSERFAATVAGVAETAWGNQSPCAEWTARDVVGHVVDMHQAMLTPVGRALSPAPTVDEDPLAAVHAARADVEAVLVDPTVARTVVGTPMGQTTVARHVDEVVSADLVLHGWDLARATFQDDTIDPAEVERMWPTAVAMPAEMRTPDAFGPGIVVFGPRVAVPDDAPLQDRLLGELGRDPDFTPR
ncbi:Conserved hypothetical protein CHP03086 [Pseudonocardia dioxanivorans CB1190]|uniref:Mycothiol-dependent maleylpyruvate isomerase metal-binding domain-containing protein n=1 Tax=Pseudonocardia dioxanivorans (strain ATCC 55486 / DSM 44775 / JCM 13855 / CB1190) TaxID=675635 RepID=F4CQI9_PSEUX|nr:TIGR03086 family metal-binding protein [Pseudonocardia dioxanivorans]AEA22587.1 Conserved hypothetical protein CHP03086 [Pseudonocardia dioxanivorans CB1190]